MKTIYIKILVIILNSIWCGVFINKELMLNASIQLFVVACFCGTLFYDLQELKNENPS